jgi:hypothetical protein
MAPGKRVLPGRDDYIISRQLLMPSRDEGTLRGERYRREHKSRRGRGYGDKERHEYNCGGRENAGRNSHQERMYGLKDRAIVFSRNMRGA